MTEETLSRIFSLKKPPKLLMIHCYIAEQNSFNSQQLVFKVIVKVRIEKLSITYMIKKKKSGHFYLF